ncbi:hypothetical protein [Janthinobacterium sp. B9-8]|uniref:hypothetical protein n=1 Tax=Janthinobacterium sp. B9-8 TaxID=1236179 RepID=UPI00069A0467|nr:hypothetical protein [Janthinobacterium sp. B9-8]AMC35240.1 hypothetical protein VN23_11765 [Janthinobacterium sp. B9-8]
MIAKLFQPKNDLSEIYTAHLLSKEGVNLIKFPIKDSLVDQGVYAYRLQFMTSEANANVLIFLLASTFNGVKNNTFQEGYFKNDKGESINFSVRSEFNGAVIEMITNSIPLLKVIDLLNLTPLPPWVVFPHIGPTALGALQGDVAYWWTWFWSPFWDNASNEEQEKYLLNNNGSTEWIEAIRAIK